MDRNAFAILCDLLKTCGGLLDDGNVTIEEQVATFVNILAHRNKNRSIQVRFYRFGETISRYVYRVLRALLRLEDVLFVKPTPVPDDCTDSRWRWFKGCLGALDGTYIEVTVPESDKPRYRTRKWHIATNVLGACTHDLKFVYVLSGWEGSSTDSRVLQDAITRHNGFKVIIIWPMRGIPTVKVFLHHIEVHGNFDMSDRRNWTLEEEVVMISILEGIVADGGRCDTGSFRPGTYEQVTSKMREKIENITLTEKHVQNKMKRMKDRYSTAYDMLNTSGFGWDDTRKCVIVDSPEILEEYLKKHSNKNYAANRPFSHYERLVVVFGKDRATSSMAESAADALDQWDWKMMSQIRLVSLNLCLLPPMLPVLPLLQVQNKHQSGRERGLLVQQQQTLPMYLKKSMERASADIAKLTEAITGGDAMAHLGVELEGMGLDRMQVIRVAMYFGNKPHQLRIWNGLNDSYKPDFVKTILDE
ncbi:hypothetical protein Dsin_021161 [Dipteronia sinensis]|uniref:Myb/SANT-like domain-containing protein n=1 Tax=Dipteronia sinensis TaxID=43782 RepID=A0AAE0E4C3_9ROSI|nr:hypothetical protein Dsin_021161 [Dipteronia sinensis]